MDAYTQSQLRERGWTVAAINRFLGEPDYVGGWSRTYYLYTEARVHAAEMTDQYRAWREASLARTARSKASASRRRAQLLQALQDWHPDFDIAEDVTLGEVIGDGIEAYNLHQRATRDEPYWADRKSDRAFLDRITVNYLRHNVTDYDDMLQELRGRVGVRDAEDLFRERVYEAIASRFPELAEECGRQLRHRRAAGTGGAQ